MVKRSPLNVSDVQPEDFKQLEVVNHGTETQNSSSSAETKAESDLQASESILNTSLSSEQLDISNVIKSEVTEYRDSELLPGEILEENKNGPSTCEFGIIENGKELEGKQTIRERNRDLSRADTQRPINEEQQIFIAKKELESLLWETIRNIKTANEKFKELCTSASEIKAEINSLQAQLPTSEILSIASSYENKLLPEIKQTLSSFENRRNEKDENYAKLTNELREISKSYGASSASQEKLISDLFKRVERLEMIGSENSKDLKLMLDKKLESIHERIKDSLSKLTADNRISNHEETSTLREEKHIPEREKLPNGDKEFKADIYYLISDEEDSQPGSLELKRKNNTKNAHIQDEILESNKRKFRRRNP